MCVPFYDVPLTHSSDPMVVLIVGRRNLDAVTCSFFPRRPFPMVLDPRARRSPTRLFVYGVLSQSSGRFVRNYVFDCLIVVLGLSHCLRLF